ncbi:MAG: hypothetical protein P4L33_21945 [Capsulimonadaceae bacterium]|nr:hypothetical protein [Capsulimonadaceae bacterium]
MESHKDTEDTLRRDSAEADRCSICLNLKKAAKATSSVLDELLAPLGIRASQLGVLNQVSVLGSPTITELADAVVSDRTTLTRNLGPLERDGYVDTFAGHDRRVRMVTLTEEGRELLQRALPLREQAEQTLIRRFGEEPWNDLLKHLDRLTAIVRKG